MYKKIHVVSTALFDNSLIEIILLILVNDDINKKYRMLLS